MTIKISPSQLDRFGCRLAWHWGRLYTPLKVAPPLQFGTGIHYALEGWYRSGTDPVALFTEWIDGEIKNISPEWEDDFERLYNDRTLGIAMLEGYLKEYQGKENFHVLATERTIERRLPNLGGSEKLDCYVTGILDAIVRDRDNGNLYVLEHKTFTQFNLGQLFRDHQFVAEFWLAQKLLKKMKSPLVGVIYNGLRKQIPSKRTKLKFFERHVIGINQSQVQWFLKRTYEMYRIISDRNLAIYPEPGQVKCNWCEFSDVCAEFMRGGDYKFILDNLFIKREARISRR